MGDSLADVGNRATTISDVPGKLVDSVYSASSTTLVSLRGLTIGPSDVVRMNLRVKPPNLTLTITVRVFP